MTSPRSPLERLVIWLRPEYRIVRDSYAGFEVQLRHWCWPFWRQANFSNTHTTIERAEKWAHEYAGGEVRRLGRLPMQQKTDNACYTAPTPDK